ncbi:MAG TPA: DUF3237 domain-containing protein [Lysobacter sp.]|jgi:hypothetical protein|nr:DUF3237 domain-containing protein [Lysobacter sp.]
MKAFIQTSSLVALMGMVSGVSASDTPHAPPIETEYLATLFAPLYPPQAANQNLLIFHPRGGGTLAGRINGKLLPPGGDWVRVMPDGTMRIDVRLSAELDDGSVLYVTYGGVLRKPDEETWKRFLGGQKIEAPQWYYVITPNFETASKKYAWLNGVQAIGKFVSIQTGEEAHVKFDIYEVK